MEFGIFNDNSDYGLLIYLMGKIINLRTSFQNVYTSRHDIIRVYDIIIKRETPSRDKGRTCGEQTSGVRITRENRVVKCVFLHKTYRLVRRNT